jgi:hypothetical protein
MPTSGMAARVAPSRQRYETNKTREDTCVRTILKTSRCVEPSKLGNFWATGTVSVRVRLCLRLRLRLCACVCVCRLNWQCVWAKGWSQEEFLGVDLELEPDWSGSQT